MVRGEAPREVDPVNIRKMTVLALFSMILFGTSFWGLVIALESIPPVTLGLFRAILVTAFMAIMILIVGSFRGNRWLFERKNLLRAGIRGKGAFLLVVSFALFSTVLPNLFQNIGMTMMDPSSTSSLSALIQGISPVLTILVALILLKEGFGRWKVIALIIAVPATFVLTTHSTGGLDLTSRQTLGAFLNLLTAGSYSVSAIILKISLNRGGRPFHLVTLNAFYGAILLFPAALIFWEAGWENPFSIAGSGAEVWLALIYVSICLYGVAPLAWYQVIKMGELSRVTFFAFLIPVFSYLVGYTLLNERLDATQMIAGVFLLFSVVVSQIREKKV